MPESKRPDPKRRSPASRPGRGGDSKRGRPRKAPAARQGPSASRAMPEVVEPIKQAMVESAEQRSDQRLGLTARRAAILAAVVCVLTLTIAGPVRTYFAQRTEMKQLAASETALRQQISDLQQQKSKLADPAYIAAQARERLGFVKPGDIPYQVQLPPGAAVPAEPGNQTAAAATNDPWYTSLWHTIADTPHGPPTPAPAAPAPPVAPGPPSPPPPGG
ncbi:MAG TPA: septum formation initiator family protein [Mycobacterium sp.]|nr:septum formation initiator family protein [Mycobacterium sp.]